MITTYVTLNGKIRSEQRSGEAHPRDYVLDPLGSVIQIYQNGWPIADACYEPYGGIYTQWNMEGKTFTWLGGWGYRQTGVEWSSVYVRARHYSRGLSNWTSIDPLWPSEMAYGYVDNEVLYWVDPSGLQRGVRNGGGSTSTNQGRNIWGRPAPRPAVGRDRMGRPFQQPPRQWPSQPPVPIGPQPQPCLPFDPRPYWGVPLPKPNEYPRHDPVITGSTGSTGSIDPCVELENSKARRKAQLNASKLGFKPPNGPGRVTPSECDRLKRALDNARRICEIRDDELKWRCFDPWDDPATSGHRLDGPLNIANHRLRASDCWKNHAKWAKIIKKECGGIK